MGVYTPDIIARAKVLRSAGYSYSEMGRFLGVSKNSILSAYKRYVEFKPTDGHVTAWMLEAGREARVVIPTLAYVGGLDPSPRYTMKRLTDDQMSCLGLR